MVCVPLPLVGCDLKEWGKEVRSLKLSEEVIREEGLSLSAELEEGWEEAMRGRRGRPRSEALEVLSEDSSDVFMELLEESGEKVTSVSLSNEAASSAKKAEKEAAALAKKEAAAAKKAEKEAAALAKKEAAAAKKAEKEAAALAKKEAAAAKKAEKEAAALAKKEATDAKKAEKEAAALAKKEAADAKKAAALAKKEAADAKKAAKESKKNKPAPELLAAIGAGQMKAAEDNGELQEEAYDEEEVSVRVFEHEGMKWLKDDTGCIYHPESHEEVGKWNEVGQKIELFAACQLIPNM
jgi:hypothetical protein